MSTSPTDYRQSSFPSSSWYELAPSFCAGSAVGPPETFSAITSIIITLIGLFASSTSHHSVAGMKVIYCMLVLNGIAAFGYHSTFFAGWSMADGQTLLFATALTTHLITDEILHERFYKRGSRIVYRILSFLAGIVLIGATMFVNAGLASKEFGGDLVFLPAVVAMAVFGYALVFLMMRTTHKQFLDQHPQGGLLKTIVNRSLIFLLSSSIIWAIGERGCDLVPEAGRAAFGGFTHGIWHIGSSYGVYQLSQFLLIIYADNYGLTAWIRYVPRVRHTVDSWCEERVWHYKMWPSLALIVEYDTPKKGVTVKPEAQPDASGYF